ncbi:uncharacterized protein LOC111907662 [Lactuca sativa]|uniref:Myb-like domain-containing protein n=1 Tax=Lactuca sativa TaxID=4236 RepID=A0A9R1UVP4_LACSA|nr:uncharacterized protein LOC111907662 [Lactuca sativa]KAJ0193725.1 hypothetical protein LSAT_V11C800424580 [Lactuca sativa]
MATDTPSPPPTASHEEEEDNINQQPPTQQELVLSPPSPIEDVDQHQQFENSNSPYSPRTSVTKSEKPIDREHPPPEDVADEQEPVPTSPPPQDKMLGLQQPSPPPSPSSFLQPSPPPPPPPPPLPTEPEYPPENLSPGHESPISKKSPSSPKRDEHPLQSPNYRETPYPNPNPNSDHESPSPSSPATLQGNPSPKPHKSPKDPSPSPPPTAASPSSPPLLQAVASSSPTKQQILPWTHQETANLIQAYQEKWYSLKKGPLKASQWEEVAITVAARCGYDEPTKTAKQCRHKIEKLRKRYRAERGKPRSKATAWNFFKLMDNLEKGPLPISSSLPSMELVEYQKPSNSNGKKRKNNDDGDSEFLVNKRSRSKISSNHHISNGSDARFSDGGHDRVMRGLRTPVVHKHKGFYQEEEEDDSNEEDEDNEEGVAAQLAAEIKGFAEKFVKIENKKIEMIKDVERYRLEMENKRMEMILESQQMLVETVNKAFGGSHKPHKLSAN